MHVCLPDHLYVTSVVEKKDNKSGSYLRLGLTGVHALPRLPGSVMDNHKGAIAVDQSTLEELQVLEGHTDRVWCVAWSPSGAPPVCLAQLFRGWDVLARLAHLVGDVSLNTFSGIFGLA